MIKRMMLKLCLLGALVSGHAQGSHDPLVQREQIEMMIDSFVENGVISEADAQAAREQLEQMSEEEWRNFVNNAQKFVEENPGEVREAIEDIDYNDSFSRQ